MKEIMNVITATPIKATLSLVPVIQSNGIKAARIGDWYSTIAVLHFEKPLEREMLFSLIYVMP